MTGDFNALIEEEYGHNAVGSEYIVLDESESTAVEVFFKTREEAIDHASCIWSRSSYWDKKHNSVKAARIEWEPLDDTVIYEIYETVWSSSAEGRAPSGATSAFVHVRSRRDGTEHSVPFGMDGEYFDADHAFVHARRVLENDPSADVEVEFFRDGDGEFDELGVIEVV